ncbi:MAG: hypothetical protein M1817_006506 [Caeruleum heppii]|nr:MAG: hypothetical protein M1817_006506 [Caeruleum heppii]
MEGGSRRGDWRRESSGRQIGGGPQRSDVGPNPQTERSQQPLPSGSQARRSLDNTGGEEGSLYGYYGNLPQFQDPTLPRGALALQAQYGQTSASQHHQSQSQPQPAQLSQYGSGLNFDLSHQPPPVPTSYGPSSLYPQRRQSTAIEVLSTHFAGGPTFYMPSESANVRTPGSSQQTPTQFSSTSYLQGESSRGSSLSQTYATGSMGGVSHPAPIAPATDSGSVAEPPNYDEAYDRYQVAVKRVFHCVHHGQLLEAGQLLLEISEWLLSNAVDLGLIIDDQDLYGERLKLWKDFNTAWLATLQQQKDLAQNMAEAGQGLNPPQSLIQPELLERMGRELVRLCDGVERHGLVDYEMGVWEEEIITGKRPSN